HRDFLPAKEYAPRVLQLSPNDATAHLLLGRVLLSTKEFAAAREQFSAAQSLAPNDPLSYVETARAYAGEKKDSSAEKQFAAALRINPHYPAALDQFTQFLVSRNRRAEAISRAKQYLANFSDDATGTLILG